MGTSEDVFSLGLGACTCVVCRHSCFYLDDFIPSQRGNNFQRVYSEASRRPVTTQEGCLCGTRLMQEEALLPSPYVTSRAPAEEMLSL